MWLDFWSFILYFIQDNVIDGHEYVTVILKNYTIFHEISLPWGSSLSDDEQWPNDGVERLSVFSVTLFVSKS